MASRYCTNCGHELNEDTRFCPGCGQPAHETASVATPEADVPLPPPPGQQAASYSPQQTAAPQGRSTFSKVLIGCGSLVVLLFLVVGCSVIVANLGGGGDTASNNPPAGGQDQQGANEQQAADEQPQAVEEEPQAQEEEPAPQEDNGTQTKDYGIGDKVNVGDVSYTVTNAEAVTTLRDPLKFDPPLKGNYIVITFTFANNGSEPATVSDLGMYLYDSQGSEYETDTDAALYLPDDKSLFMLDRVNPGLSQEVQTVYAVPPDAGGFELEVTSGFFATETARIKMGF